ncbi:hypothetical protein PYCCODRAFT_1448798 [Trametes coccinea BRFM310]|uniref:AB hydrolase-1 domain-containing protein n=1 Tax=Trametes coccinea (strain BRFM310) TaxID=1353009 RepID=A0A1Y2J810_TRAC3|nr:hypothetical protein PYCCODRAFT_1448798 [Trametes coccinea BRFM310]
MATDTGTALRATHDTGVPQGSSDYTTLVLIHGYRWQPAIFKRLLPFACKFNTRIVLLARRDYPGASPYTDHERATITRLYNSPRSPTTEVEMAAILTAHGRDVYDFLVDYVAHERIPPAKGCQGGIILVGWSLGATSITALLANLKSYPVGAVSLDTYVRRVILYETSHIFYAHPYPPECYQPLHDLSLSPEDGMTLFDRWLSSHFTHGDIWADGPSALAMRTADPEPPSLFATFTAEDLAELTYTPPAAPTGSDHQLMIAGMTHGTYGKLKDAAFFPDEPGDAIPWPELEVRMLWGDKSFWESPWGVYLLSRELEEAKKEGRRTRDIELVRFKGANHFAHWIVPEKTLAAFLSNDVEVS